MATPMVAAVGALARHLNPGLRPGEAAAILEQSARRPRGAWTADLGWGILDGAAAVRAAAALDRTPPSSHVLPTAARRRARTVRLRWTGRDLATPLAPLSGMARYELWRRAGTRPW